MWNVKICGKCKRKKNSKKMRIVKNIKKVEMGKM
jgi:hypothetical protein